VTVYIPTNSDGRPDLDGLLARLRLDPAEVERDRQRVAEALTQVERLRAALQSVLSIDDDYPLDPSGYDPDEYQRLRGIIDAARAALAERGGEPHGGAHT